LVEKNDEKNPAGWLKKIRLIADGLFLACLHVQNKRGFFGGPAFIHPIRAI